MKPFDGVNWPLVALVVGVAGLPAIVAVLAKFADWLETTRLGDWVREQERKHDKRTP